MDNLNGNRTLRGTLRELLMPMSENSFLLLAKSGLTYTDTLSAFLLTVDEGGRRRGGRERDISEQSKRKREVWGRGCFSGVVM